MFFTGWERCYVSIQVVGSINSDVHMVTEFWVNSMHGNSVTLPMPSDNERRKRACNFAGASNALVGDIVR